MRSNSTPCSVRTEVHMMMIVQTNRLFNGEVWLIEGTRSLRGKGRASARVIDEGVALSSSASPRCLPPPSPAFHLPSAACPSLSPLPCPSPSFLTQNKTKKSLCDDGPSRLSERLTPKLCHNIDQPPTRPPPTNALPRSSIHSDYSSSSLS